MWYKKKLIVLFFLILLLTGIQYSLPYSPYTVEVYDQYFFRPYQAIRNVIFGFIPLSIGDLLYLLGGIGLIIVIGRWIFFIVKYKSHKQFLWTSILHSVIVIAIVYLFFFLGWGGNYYKPSLTTYWDLDKTHWQSDSALWHYDKFLVTKLNEYAPHYKGLRFRDVDKKAQLYFKEYTDRKTKLHGLNVKPSIFGYLMQHLGIQGYYNPFTGEAQVNRFLPSFMLPFVVSHEMAHQAGIAAEDDANLLAYVLSTRVNDTAFKYSAYFNIWLYTNARLKAADSASANFFKSQLNAVTQKHLDTLREIRRRYNSNLSDYSGFLYDGYLKMHNQSAGIRSYNRVASSAWAWEQSKDTLNIPLIKIP